MFELSNRKPAGVRPLPHKNFRPPVEILLARSGEGRSILPAFCKSTFNTELRARIWSEVEEKAEDKAGEDGYWPSVREESDETQEEQMTWWRFQVTMKNIGINNGRKKKDVKMWREGGREGGRKRVVGCREREKSFALKIFSREINLSIVAEC